MNLKTNLILSILMVVISLKPVIAADNYFEFKKNKIISIDDQIVEQLSNKKVAVLIHGGSMNRSLLKPLEKNLVNRDYSILSYNYSFSQNAKALSDDLNRDLLSLIDKVPSDEILIIGHSMGGVFARKILANLRSDKQVTFITIASPFSGVKKADLLFGNDTVFAVTQKLIPQIPITDLMRDFTSKSEFIKHYENLPSNVTHIKITTDEAGYTSKVIGSPILLNNDSIVMLEDQKHDDVDKNVSKHYFLEAGHESAVNIDSSTISLLLNMILNEIGI